MPPEAVVQSALILVFGIGPESADSVEKLFAHLNDDKEGVNLAWRVLSNTFSVEKDQSRALWRTVDFQWQSFSTLSAKRRSLALTKNGDQQMNEGLRY